MADEFDPNYTYTDPEVIQQRFLRARQFAGKDVGHGGASPLAGLVFGLTSGLGNLSAENASSANQALTRETLRGAASQPNESAMAKYLLNSSVPGLATKGLDIYGRTLDPVRQQQLATGQLDYERALATRVGGIGQAITKEIDPAKQQMLMTQLASHPGMKAMLDKAFPGGWGNDPSLVGNYISQIAQGYSDPGKAELTASEVAKNKAQALEASERANNAKVQVNQVTGEYYNQKGPLPNQTQGPQGALIFGKEFAKDQAPKLYAESSKLYTDAADTHNIMTSLEELAPYAKTGWGGPQLLQLRKLGAQLGIKDDSIAPTELFQFLAQKGVFELTKQLKPASNLDMIASERATASLQSDPSTLTVALPVLKAVAQRSMLRHQLEMEFYKRGLPPDTPGIMAQVNKTVPLDLSSVSQQNGPAAGPRVQKQFGDRAPSAAPAVGEVKTGRDGVSYRFKGGAPADPNSWERVQ